MDKRVYFLMIVAFVIGMVELIISGILDLIAEDLQVSLAQAGFLITIFSLIFAIASPILLIMTSKIERKKLTTICLIIFFIGNIVTVFSPNYSTLMIGRIIMALSGALLIILCLVMAPNIVEHKYRGRAIGLVSMGVSGSLVLGVPFGIVLGNAFGWRAPFVLIGVLTIISIIGVHFLMERIQPKPSTPLREQLATLKSNKILLAHLTLFLFIGGHSVLYTYLKPYIGVTMGLEGTWVSVIFFVFGVAAVSGGGLGGLLSDTLGSTRTILIATVVFSVTIFLIPWSTFALWMFLIGIVVWGALSWVISPAMQSYLIETSPETSDIQQSLSNSSLHFGIAFGSYVGGLVIERTSVEQNPTIGGIMVILSIITAILSIRSKHKLPSRKAQQLPTT